MSSRLLIFALIAIALAAAIVWYARSDRIEALPSTPAEHTNDIARDLEQLAGEQAPPRPRSRLRRVTRQERDRLAAKIAELRTPDASRPRAKITLDDKPPTVPAHESPDPAVRKFNDRALEELSGAQPFLSKCFDQHRAALPANLTVQTKLLILTDPDLGAVVSADALTDPDGKPLPAAFDDCIRDMLQTFTLPPLPPTDDSQFLLALQLSFRDDD
jgi:hypothetical protein